LGSQRIEEAQLFIDAAHAYETKAEAGADTTAQAPTTDRDAQAAKPRREMPHHTEI